MSDRTNHIFVWDRPTHDLDGEEFSVFGTDEEADERAASVATLYGCVLWKIGTRDSGGFVPCVPDAELPWWALEAAVERRDRLAKASASRHAVRRSA